MKTVVVRFAMFVHFAFDGYLPIKAAKRKDGAAVDTPQRRESLIMLLLIGCGRVSSTPACLETRVLHTLTSMRLQQEFSAKRLHRLI